MFPKSPKDIAEGFFNLTHKIRVRFDTSRADRERIMNELDNNRQPTGYRVEFINNAVAEILETVKKVCREFNSDHPDDIATVDDMLDILKSAIHRIKPK